MIDLVITGRLAVGPGADQDAIRDRAGAALTDPDAGLLSPRRMTIGQRLYRSEVEAALTVSGVQAVLHLQIEPPQTGPAAAAGTDNRPAAARRDQPRRDQPGQGQPGHDQPSLDPGPDGYFRLLPERLTLDVVTYG